MIETEFAAAMLAPSTMLPTGLEVWNGSDPHPRLNIYRNNIIASLTAALADSFPVVEQLVGREFFRAMAVSYIRQAPPRTPVMAHYGHGFPEFIAQFRPARSVPYLADIARLERARTHAYHAADAQALSHRSVLAALAGDGDAAELCVRCHPSVSVVQSPYAVVSLWAAHQGDGELASIDTNAGESALVVRVDLDVLVIRLRQDSARFIAALLDGLEIGVAADRVIDTVEAFDIVDPLGLLVRHGAVIAIAASRRHNS